MKLEADEKTILVESLLALLDQEATQDSKRPDSYISTPGAKIISDYGLTKDARGDTIRPEINYNWPVFKKILVNHRQIIGRIISEARDIDEMETRLAEHLAKYPKDKAGVIRTIQATRN